MSFDVIVSQTLRNQHPQVLTTLTAAELVDRAVMPLRKGGKGYQHPPAPSEVHKLILDLAARRSEIPRPLLLNDRSGSEQDLAARRGPRAKWTPSDKLYLIDGQTRLAALTHLVDEDPQSWADLEIPISCLIGLSELEEIEIFYLNNATRPQSTDLATSALRKAGNQIPGEPAWRFKADHLADKIAATPPWQGRIRQAGAKKGKTTINARSFATTLRPLLKSPLFSALSSKQQAAVVSAYWQGIAQVLPEAFKEPADYAIQKTTGAMALNTVLLDVIERMRSRGASLKDPDQFAAEIKTTLLSLSGINQSGEEVSGAQFWKSGPEGVAGGFSGDSGRRLLASTIRKSLAPLTI